MPAVFGRSWFVTFYGVLGQQGGLQQAWPKFGQFRAADIVVTQKSALVARNRIMAQPSGQLLLVTVRSLDICARSEDGKWTNPLVPSASTSLVWIGSMAGALFPTKTAVSW